MKFLISILSLSLLMPAAASPAASERGETVYSFDFKVAKQRKKRDKKGGGANSVTNEVWNYKVEIENRSLEGVGELEVEYTYFITTETRSASSRRESTRKVAGEAKVAAIARGNRGGFETKTSPLRQSEKTERKASKSRRASGNNKDRKTQIKVTQVREKLDGIKIEVYHRGAKIAEHVLGDAAKRTATKRK